MLDYVRTNFLQRYIFYRIRAKNNLEKITLAYILHC